MALSNNIEEYYNTIKEDYPELTLQECKLICSSPFKFTKEVMSRGLLRNVRLKYFARFEVSPSRVKYNKKQLQENYDNNVISQQRYLDRLKVLNNYEEV